jgi:hypothetical protein
MVEYLRKRVSLPSLGVVYVTLQVLINGYCQYGHIIVFLSTVIGMLFPLSLQWIINILIKDEKKSILMTAVFLFAFIFLPKLSRIYVEYSDEKYSRLFLYFFLVSPILIIIVYIVLLKSSLALKYFNFVSAVLLVANLSTLIYHAVCNVPCHAPDIASHAISGAVRVSENKEKPNIYYIVMDAYASSASLNHYYQYNNSEFDDKLTGMGFFVSKNSRSHYYHTLACMASNLNLSLLSGVSIYNSFSFANTSYFALIKKSLLVRRFLANGYSFVNYSPFDIENKPCYYSIDIFFPNPVMSMLSSPNLFELKKIIITSRTFTPLFPNIKILKQLESEAGYDVKSPKFKFVHLMMPHPPYEYDESGKFSHIVGKKAAYLSQLKYLNTEVLQTVSHIVAVEKENAIIILQGDHGSREIKNKWKIDADEATAVYAAFRLTNDFREVMHDAVDPLAVLKELSIRYGCAVADSCTTPSNVQ